MCVVLSPVYLTELVCILRLVKRVFVDSSVLLRCYYAFILPILEYCSPVWGSAAEYHLQLLERQVCSVARLCSDHSFSFLVHCVIQGKFELEPFFVQWASFCFCLNSTYPSCGCSSTIRVWSIKVCNVPICNAFPAGPDSSVEAHTSEVTRYVTFPTPCLTH